MDVTVFVAVTSVAVVLQACVLIGMLLVMRKTIGRVDALADDIRTKVLPIADTVQSMLTELRPKIETTVTNASEAAALIHGQMERLDATVNDVIDRTRLQIIRADDLVTRTMDRVEETTEVVHNAVTSPVRRFAGVVHGLTVGLEQLVNFRRRHRNANAPQDEMFI
jgi:methyl-accepting chemotaxis protein